MLINIQSSKRPVSSKAPTTTTPTPELMANTIRAAWERGEISQKDVARDLGIHQSQFSKLVNGQFKETRGHAVRLFEYSIRKASTSQRNTTDVNADALRLILTQRLMSAWDGTTEGAKALEAILEGAARLRASRPSRRQR